MLFCANLSHAPATADDALNASTGDFDLLPLPDVAGFVWPDDFPTTPTF